MASSRAPRFTKRKNGKRMATVKYALHIPEDVVLEVQKALGVSKAKAFAAIVREFDCVTAGALAWRFLAVQDIDDGEGPFLTTEHVDNLPRGAAASQIGTPVAAGNVMDDVAVFARED